jgi:RimJ/RimL family protein N-acetyltransferase
MQILTTPRLTLRHLEPGDLDAVAQMYADPEVRRYTRTEPERESRLQKRSNGFVTAIRNVRNSGYGQLWRRFQTG